MSLNLRIILSATLVLMVFITLTAAALDRAFVDSSESGLRDKLTSQLYALMAAAEVSDAGVVMPSNELDALLGLPSSGVYAFVTNQDGETVWQSSSALGAKPPAPLALPGGERQFDKKHSGDADYYTFAYGVNWATSADTVSLTFNIATDLASFDKQIARYRTTLWSWLVAMAILLLISQALILRWGLSPLRRVGVELNRIESGEQERIEESYPQEIDRLTTNINILLKHERDQKARYRDALGDLAHSLKTPLAVMQSGLTSVSRETEDAMREQISHMNKIVEYQLQRAATAGSATLGQSVDVKSVVERMLESLRKVYRDKIVTLDVRIENGLVFRGDEGDLMELLGNLLDNAFKWSVSRVEIIAESQGKQVLLRVIDDGPGIDPDQVGTLLQRGMRADQAAPGHGIGLSIVRNIVDAYKGDLIVSKSHLGGCEVRVML
jgi:two-component system sensor histidine kinase PhoQ